MTKLTILPAPMRRYPWLGKRTDDQIVAEALAKLSVRLAALLSLEQGERP
ncbi:MAG: hypothetical protein JWR51_4677 [Devosia sp.]|nr:hypothetical protein [Devosia sp.]